MIAEPIPCQNGSEFSVLWASAPAKTRRAKSIPTTTIGPASWYNPSERAQHVTATSSPLRENLVCGHLSLVVQLLLASQITCRITASGRLLIDVPRRPQARLRLIRLLSRDCLFRDATMHQLQRKHSHCDMRLSHGSQFFVWVRNASLQMNQADSTMFYHNWANTFHRLVCRRIFP